VPWLPPYTWAAPTPPSPLCCWLPAESPAVWPSQELGWAWVVLATHLAPVLAAVCLWASVV
jgi:hypothetical protein